MDLLKIIGAIALYGFCTFVGIMVGVMIGSSIKDGSPIVAIGGIGGFIGGLVLGRWAVSKIIK